MKHRKFEEKEVYPRLDQSLDETQKNILLRESMKLSKIVKNVMNNT